MHVKKGDNVIVTTGKHKGASGAVARVIGERIIVDGVNKVKIHVRAKSKTEKGSIVEREASIHHSNVVLAEKKAPKKAKAAK